LWLRHSPTHDEYYSDCDGGLQFHQSFSVLSRRRRPWAAPIQNRFYSEPKLNWLKKTTTILPCGSTRPTPSRGGEAPADHHISAACRPSI
jgi:hypothetical protein